MMSKEKGRKRRYKDNHEKKHQTEEDKNRDERETFSLAKGMVKD